MSERKNRNHNRIWPDLPLNLACFNCSATEASDAAAKKDGSLKVSLDSKTPMQSASKGLDD